MIPTLAIAEENAIGPTKPGMRRSTPTVPTTRSPGPVRTIESPKVDFSIPAVASVGLPFGLTPGDWEDTLSFAPKYIPRVRRVRDAGEVVGKDSYTMMLGMCKLKDVQRDAEKTIFGSAVGTWLKNNEGKDYGDACIHGRRVGDELWRINCFIHFAGGKG